MNSTGTARSQDAIALKARLRRELRWLRARLIGHAALMLLAGGGLLLAVAIVSSPSWNSVGPIGAWLVWIGLAIGGAWLLAFEVVEPLRRLANLKGFSRELERHGDYRNLLEAATQFTSPRKLDPLRTGASQSLVAEVLLRARRAVEATSLSPRIPLPGVLPHLALLLLVALAWTLLAWLAPARIHLGLAALADPHSLAAVSARAGLFAVEGDVRIPIAEDVTLRAHDFSAGDEPVRLLVNRTADFWEELPTERQQIALAPAPYSEFRAELRHVEDPLRYRFRKGDLLSRVHEIAVRQRPVLRELGARFVPPAYAGQDDQSVEDLGGVVRVLVGTRVELRGRASAPLASARRVVEDGEATSLSVDGDFFGDEFEVLQNLSFRIELTDTEELASEARTIYRFVAVPDDPPTIELTRPSDDLTLDRDLLVAVSGLAADDVGLAQVDLLHRTEEESEWRRTPLYRSSGPVGSRADIRDLQFEQGEEELAFGFGWDLGEQSLFPGDTMLFCLEAVDNNAIEGGQRTRSQVIRLRLPTIGEVFAEERAERTENQDELGSMLEEGEELRETLERLDRELKKNPDPDWAKQQEIKDALERQEALKEKLQDAAQDLQNQLDDFARDNAGSMELMEKMQTIQELLETIQDENLQSYLDAMREAMDQLMPHEIQRAMEDALANQEEYNRRLDRTIELLRQLEREREMSDLVEEVAEQLERQEDLIDAGQPQDPSESEEDSQGDERSSEGERSETDEEGQSGEDARQQMSDEELARAQEKLAEEMEELEQRLQEALEKLKEQQETGEAEDRSAEEMSDALEEAQNDMQNEGKPSEAMNDSSTRLQNQQREEAQQQQEEARRRLLRLYETLQQGQEAMQMASAQFASEKLQQTAFDLLQLSFGEEKIADALVDGVQGQRLAPVIREQGRIHRAAETLSDDLHELASKNFAIQEALLAEMRNLLVMLDDSVEELQLSRARRSQASATVAMGQMNKIVMNLLTAAMSQGQGQGSGSQMSMSQQMQQMSEDQSRLNAMTEQMRRSMEQGLSEQERRQLADLRGQQEALRRQLDEMRQEIEDERRILGDLDELGDEMEEVIEGLESGRLDDQLQRQQEKILSRMLDAQRSIRERDFAKERQSRGSDQLFGLQEGATELWGEGELQQQLRRWLAPDKAPQAYEDDVRRYFRRIQDELQRGGGQ